MFFVQYPAREASLSYLFGCGGRGKAVAVDVIAGDEGWFAEEAERRGVRITHVIDTHVHADHYSGGPALAALTGAPYCLHESNSERVRHPFQPLRDGDRIEAGNVSVEVLHTPGHTPDSICLLVTDNTRTAEPWLLLTGDTLFVGSIGRPDLGSEGKAWAGQLFESLHQRLLTLPDTLEIFPGHQAGSVCGAGISGKPSSTIGFEKQWNPGLAISDRGEFIDYILKDIPPRPAEMERIVTANLGA